MGPVVVQMRSLQHIEIRLFENLTCISLGVCESIPQASISFHGAKSWGSMMNDEYGSEASVALGPT